MAAPRADPALSCGVRDLPALLQPAALVHGPDGGGPDTGDWVGLRNYGDLLRDPHFWNATKNSAVMVSASLAIQVVLGVALAMFFNLHLRGAWLVRGILVLPMLITPIVVGVMWRGPAQPGLGADQLVHRGSRSRAAELVRLHRDGDAHADPRRILAVDAVRLHHRLRPPAGAAAGDFRGRDRRRRQAARHVPLCPRCRCSCPQSSSPAVFRAVDSFRSFDLIFGLSYGGPARSTTTLSFFSFQNGFQWQNYGYAAAVSYMMLLILAVGTIVLLRFVQIRPGYAK